jgi:hypothetical protein
MVKVKVMAWLKAMTLSMASLLLALMLAAILWIPCLFVTYPVTELFFSPIETQGGFLAMLWGMYVALFSGFAISIWSNLQGPTGSSLSGIFQSIRQFFSDHEAHSPKPIPICRTRVIVAYLLIAQFICLSNFVLDIDGVDPFMIEFLGFPILCVGFMMYHLVPYYLKKASP